MEFKSFEHWRREHQTILDKIYSLSSSDHGIGIQKQKFKLLTNLIKELCISKNSKSKFNNISSLILLLLNLYKKKYPLDICSNLGKRPSEPIRKINSEVKRILRSEFLFNS